MKHEGGSFGSSSLCNELVAKRAVDCSRTKSVKGSVCTLVKSALQLVCELMFRPNFDQHMYMTYDTSLCSLQRKMVTCVCIAKFGVMYVCGPHQQ